MVERPNVELYKVELYLLKIIPIVLACIHLANTVLSYYGIDIILFSYIGSVSLIPLIFLYISSYVFKFCEYHRMFLHYIAMNKQEVDELLKVYGVKLENNTLYDYVYVANMCKADFLGSSVPDEGHLCKYVKDVIDDVDAYDGIVFNRWYADMCRSGVPIDWEEMIKQ